jgi:hypothetical protein
MAFTVPAAFDPEQCRGQGLHFGCGVPRLQPVRSLKGALVRAGAAGWRVCLRFRHGLPL